MARHIMAVCVVCLLCADRLPCEEHLSEVYPSDNDETPAYMGRNIGEVHGNVGILTIPSIESTYRPPNGYETSGNTNEKRNTQVRQKRHAGHGASPTLSQPKITEDFLHRIFDEFADGDTINAQEFQRFLQQLGLKRLLNPSQNNTCISEEVLVELVQPHGHSHHHHSDVNCKDKTSANLEATSPCENAIKEEHAHSIDSKNYTLKEQDILNLCPVLLYQLSSNSDTQRAGCIDSGILAAIDNYEISQFNVEHVNSIHVWIYAFISVFACSTLGLVGVAIIPFMDSRYYKHIIQFLVSLAVGTMTGDAVLHLLPHALIGQSEQNMVFKGLTCMGGIIFFYITEHGLTMISEWRKRIAKKETKKPSRVKVMREPDASVNNSITGDKLCKSKYSSYPYCYDEIAMDTKNDVWMHLPATNADGNPDVDRKRNGKTEDEAGEMAAQSLLSTSQNCYAPVAEMNFRHHQHQQHLPGSNTISTDLDGNSVNDGAALDNTAAANGNGGAKEKALANDTVTVILREHESSHHGHSHKHGHVHSPPESLSAVAWMIIMGDGLHNFTDGMAIGAAFADNLAGGFSTSLAVFCHELPHELGDFAILMKAGMSVKSAVYYNLLTGVLSFVGMIFGIVFGQTQDSAQWMFAAAAGLFIYIALVDMMPELSAAHKSLEQFVLQILGMISGVLLMLLIALYEEDLMTVFSSPPTH